MNKNLEIINKLGLKYNRISPSGEILSLCPLHQDKNASLAININSGKFHCFAGCMKGNSIKELVFKLTGETIKGEGEVWLESFKRKLFYKQQRNHLLPAIPKLPLAINNRGEDYLSMRGFSKETIKQWKLQWWESEKAVVIPIEGIGYVLRYLEGEKKYKYLPGTEVSRTLFGQEHYFTLDNSAILVEGSLDCIWLHQNGFRNALAILGSNLSEEQFALLKGFCLKVNILLDGDESGRKSANEISRKLKRDFMVRICELPEGKDPQQCDEIEIQNSLVNARRV